MSIIGITAKNEAIDGEESKDYGRSCRRMRRMLAWRGKRREVCRCIAYTILSEGLLAEAPRPWVERSDSNFTAGADERLDDLALSAS